MASFRGTRFPGPMFNKSVLGNNFNVNQSGEIYPRPQIQGPVSGPYGPTQPPERFVHGNFQNRPHFSNIPEPMLSSGFRNMLPSPNQVLNMNLPPPNQVLNMNLPPPNQMFRMNPPPNNPVFCMNTPPPNQVFHMNSPPPNQVFHMNSPPPNQAFRMNSPPPNQVFHLNLNPPNQVFSLNTNPSNQRLHVNAPPPNQNFVRNPPPTVNIPRFGCNFDPHKPRFQKSSFRGSKSFQKQQGSSVMQSHQSRELPLKGNRKRKQKSREFRKLKSWMTDELFVEVKKKNTLYLKAKSSDEQTAWQEFRLQRNRVSSLIKEAKIKAGLIIGKIKEEDTTEKPFHCDTCDRGFVTESELGDHLSLHIKCDRRNCLFEAHPKIVALHQRMQHDTGYAERIGKLKDDAEIQKWREERKRRFPTAENIRKRKAEQVEKEARGEVLETKEFGKFKRRKEGYREYVRNGGGRYRRFNRNRRFQNTPFSRPFTVTVDSQSDTDSDSHISLNAFKGLPSLTSSDQELHNENCDVSKTNEKHLILCEQNLPKSDCLSVRQPDIPHDDINSSNKKTDRTSVLLNDEKNEESIPLDEPIVSTGISTGKLTTVEDLVSPADESVCEIPMIELDSEKTEVVVLEDSDNEVPDSVPIAESLEQRSIVNIDSDEGPEAAPIMKVVENVISSDRQDLKTDINGHHDISATKERKLESNWKGHKFNKGFRKEQPDSGMNGFSHRQDHISQAQNRKSSLLEKLLANDIRHERNVILQCVRHIVNNNYFGVAYEKSSK